MLKYIFKRILVFIPTLLIICLVAFTINSFAPGDPVSRLLSGSLEKPENSEYYEVRYQQLRHQMGLDLPVFYCSVKTLADPDTLYKISNEKHLHSLIFLTNTFGNWAFISEYYLSLNVLIKETNQYPSWNKLLKLIAQSKDVNQIDFLFNGLMKETGNENNSKFILVEHTDDVYQNWLNIKNNKQTWKCFIPSIHFYSDNQFHRWFFGDGNSLTGANAINTKGIIRGDFGKSYITGKSVGKQLLEKTQWTVFFSLASIFLAFLISIPIGVVAGSKPGKLFDKWTTNTLAVFYSLPTFFAASLLLMLFANPDVFKWFPASGIAPITGLEENTSLLRKLTLSLPYIVLPLICYTYSSLAFLSRTIRSGMVQEMNKEYILSARARGISEKSVIWNHAFRNALFPLITVIAYIFPAMIGGSAILETIFSIPGLGLEIVNSIFSQDYPIIIAVFIITGVLTLIGYLVSDVLYAYVDPRVKLN